MPLYNVFMKKKNIYCNVKAGNKEKIGVNNNVMLCERCLIVGRE